VAGYLAGEQVGSVDVDLPQTAHAVDGIGDGIEVLGEAGRGDEAVNAAVAGDDVAHAVPDRVRVRDVGVVGRDGRAAWGRGVIALEVGQKVGGLGFGFVLFERWVLR
jgi:hypothetical protein